MPRGVPAAQIAPPLPGLAARPVSHVRAPGEESDPRSQLSRHPCRTYGAPGYTKAVRRYIGVARPGSPASARIRHGRPYAPATAGRPARGTAIRMPCRHSSRSAAGRATRRQPPWAREFPEILPSTRRHPGNRSERKPPAALLAHRRRQPRHSRPGASARLSTAREAGMGAPRTLSVAVREKADGAHRPSWRPGRRPLYVRGHRNPSTHGDTP
jgi:hypothetical protein